MGFPRRLELGRPFQALDGHFRANTAFVILIEFFQVMQIRSFVNGYSKANRRQRGGNAGSNMPVGIQDVKTGMSAESLNTLRRDACTVLEGAGIPGPGPVHARKVTPTDKMNKWRLTIINILSSIHQ